MVVKLGLRCSGRKVACEQQTHSLLSLRKIAIFTKFGFELEFEFIMSTLGPFIRGKIRRILDKMRPK